MRKRYASRGIQRGKEPTVLVAAPTKAATAKGIKATEQAMGYQSILLAASVT